jgi:hypothetical protein
MGTKFRCSVTSYEMILSVTVSVDGEISLIVVVYKH